MEQRVELAAGSVSGIDRLPNVVGSLVVSEPRHFRDCPGAGVFPASRNLGLQSSLGIG
jgi:hypothetical protein